MHLTIKERFGLDDYYANSVVQETKAKQKSLEEFNKLYVKNKQAEIKAVKKKLKKEKARFTTIRKIKQSFINGKPLFPKHSKEQKAGNFYVVRTNKKTDLYFYYHAYQFEHEYLDQEIKKLKARIGSLTFKFHKYEEALKGLKSNISSVVFGS